MGKITKAAIAFGCLFLVTVASFVVASGVQSTWWSVNVSIIEIPDGPNDEYILKAKLYVPDGVSDINPAPGVLAVHGYNNDKDVQRPHAIELSKRGIVVLAVDTLNHGDSSWANTSLPGVESVPYGALDYLRNLTFVDPTKLAVTGHSMGAFAALSIALANPDLEAIAPIAFSPGLMTLYGGFLRVLNPDLDILHVGSWGEEFGREYNETIDEFLASGLEAINGFLGITDAEFDHTYGDFTTGATRFEVLKKTHPGQTHSRKSTAAITAFFLQALLDYTEVDAFASANKGNMVYWISDLFGVFSMAGLIFSIIPLAILLMKTKYFSAVEQKMPKYRESYAPKAGVWWIFGVINAGLGFLTFVFNTSYSFTPEGGTEDVATWVFDGPMLKNWFPKLFPSAIANAFESFYLVNAGIMILLVTIWMLFIYRPKRVGFYHMGANYKIPADELSEGQAKPNGWEVFGKTFLIVLILIGYMFAVTFGASFLSVEIRGPWSGLKILTLERAVQFQWYFPAILLFFIFNAGVWMFGMMRQREYKTEALTIFVWWLKICAVMLTGLIIINLLQYVPMYLGLTGPWLNNWAIAPMMVLQLWSFYPIAAGYFLILIIFFRKTGRIWLGSISVSVIATWMMAASYIMA